MITLATLHKATRQQVFDQMAEHLLAQNEVSINSDGNCSYRGTGKLMCAAGCLISDDEYSVTMEQNGWATLVNKGVVPSDHDGIIHAMQKVHDAFDAPTQWPEAIANVAKKFSLDLPRGLKK